MPNEELPLYTLWEQVLDDLLDRTMKFPRSVRFTLARRVDNVALDILEHIVEAPLQRRAAQGRGAAAGRPGPGPAAGPGASQPQPPAPGPPGIRARLSGPGRGGQDAGGLAEAAGRVMPRCEPSFSRVASFLALVRAARVAARGHRRSPEVADFLLEVEVNALALERELLAGTYRPGAYRTFCVRDPKPRVISAPPFRDRVVHHALCAELEPALERGAAPESFACRRGKGTLAAIHHARSLARRFRYWLKLDVRRFFETASHAVLRRLLFRRVSDPGLRGLVDRLLDAGAPGSPPGRGLPIGNLTSQHFANFYLGPVDRLVKRELRPGGYCRYMDDILLFGQHREPLWTAHRRIRERASYGLELELRREVTRLAPVSEGVPFLGFVVFPGTVRFDPRRVRRWWRRMDGLERGLDAGRLSEEDAARSAASLVGWAMHGDTLMLRRSRNELAAEHGRGGKQARTG